MEAVLKQLRNVLDESDIQPSNELLEQLHKIVVSAAMSYDHGRNEITNQDTRISEDSSASELLTTAVENPAQNNSESASAEAEFTPQKNEEDAATGRSVPDSPESIYMDSDDEWENDDDEGYSCFTVSVEQFRDLIMSCGAEEEEENELAESYSEHTHDQSPRSDNSEYEDDAQDQSEIPQDMPTPAHDDGGGADAETETENNAHYSDGQTYDDEDEASGVDDGDGGDVDHDGEAEGGDDIGTEDHSNKGEGETEVDSDGDNGNAVTGGRDELEDDDGGENGDDDGDNDGAFEDTSKASGEVVQAVVGEAANPLNEVEADATGDGDEHENEANNDGDDAGGDGDDAGGVGDANEAGGGDLNAGVDYAGESGTEKDDAEGNEEGGIAVTEAKNAGDEDDNENVTAGYGDENKIEGASGGGDANDTEGGDPDAGVVYADNSGTDSDDAEGNEEGGIAVSGADASAEVGDENENENETDGYVDGDDASDDGDANKAGDGDLDAEVDYAGNSATEKDDAEGNEEGGKAVSGVDAGAEVDDGHENETDGYVDGDDAGGGGDANEAGDGDLNAEVDYAGESGTENDDAEGNEERRPVDSEADDDDGDAQQQTAVSGATHDHDQRQWTSFNLRVYHQPGKSGFEEKKDFVATRGTLVAGRYCVESKLGEAAFSTALKCVDLHPTSKATSPKKVCLKVVKNNKDYLDQSLDEIQLLSALKDSAGGSQSGMDSKHVLFLLDFFYFKEHLFIVTELLGPNLYDVCSKRREMALSNCFRSAFAIRVIAKQILDALVFVHANNIIHCDIKPENILLLTDCNCMAPNPKDVRFGVKIIDFGSSCYTTDHLSPYIQSRAYRAPEVILGVHPYSGKIDLWSLGCVLAEIFTGYVLFQSDSVQALLARAIGIIGPAPRALLKRGMASANLFAGDDGSCVYQAEDGADEVTLFKPKTSSLPARLHTRNRALLHFVDMLLQWDPEDRPGADEALAHPFILGEPLPDDDENFLDSVDSADEGRQFDQSDVSANENTPHAELTNEDGSYIASGMSANEESPYVASANEDSPYVTSANEDSPYVTATTEDSPYIASANEDSPYVTATNEDSPYVTSANEQSPYVGSADEESMCIASGNEESPYIPSVNEESPYVLSANEDSPFIPSATDDSPFIPSATDDSRFILSANEDSPYIASAKEDSPYIPSDLSANEVTPDKPAANKVTPHEPAANEGTPSPPSPHSETPLIASPNRDFLTDDSFDEAYESEPYQRLEESEDDAGSTGFTVQADDQEATPAVADHGS